MYRNGNKISFVAATFSFMATYIASAAPIPLYGVYQSTYGVTYFELSLSSVVYFIGAVVALIFFGRLSNHFGRKPIALLSILLAALSSVFFLNIHSATPLLAGRLLQGIACGLASTALAAWVVDCATSVPSWISPAVISCGPMTGLTIGGVGSGLLAQYSPTIPQQLPFIIVLIILAFCLFLITRGQETMDSRPGAIKSIKPHFALPPLAKAAFPLAIITFVSTWALGGFFQAFGPAMAREQLHTTSTVAAAFVFASIMAPSSIGASIAGRFHPKQAQLFGMISFTVFLGAILLSLKFSLFYSFLIASILTGIAQGGVLTGSIQTMVKGLQPEERANVFAVIYASSYIGAAIPTLVAGKMSESFSLLQIACWYGVLALVGSICVVSAHTFRLLQTTKRVQNIDD